MKKKHEEKSKNQRKNMKDTNSSDQREQYTHQNCGGTTLY